MITRLSFLSYHPLFLKTIDTLIYLITHYKLLSACCIKDNWYFNIFNYIFEVIKLLICPIKDNCYFNTFSYIAY